jgi:gliding motility-associated lipoprotein GldD
MQILLRKILKKNHPWHLAKRRGLLYSCNSLNKWLILMLFLVSVGCRHNEIPKPRGYYRIDFPEKKYQLFDNAYPYTFEYPVYGKIVKDTERNAEPFWMNVEFSKYKGKIHISYKAVNKNVSKFIEDAHTLAYKHTIKADAIEEEPISDDKRKVYGLVYEIRGNAASAVQFYLTDSVKNYLRGSLYFETQPNKDSLAPAIDFFRKDILHLVETLKWRK